MNKLTSVLLGALAAPLLAQGVADDHESKTPTSWLVRTNQTVSDLQNRANTGWRAVDVHMTQASPARMTVSYVRNTGVYQSAWWFYVGRTRTELQALMTSSRRPIRIHPYLSNGNVRYTALFVPNTGSNQKTYYYYTRSSLSYIQQRMTVNNARIVDHDTFVDGNTRYYTAVAIRNTGADQRAWYLAPGLTTSQIGPTGTARSMQTYDIERRSDGRYNVLYVRRPSSTSLWYYTGRTLSQLDDLSKQNGARIYDVESYVTNGSRRYAALMIQNQNDLSVRVGRQLRSGTDGSRGFILQRRGGSRLASLMAGFEFDPASTVKQLHAVYALRRVRTSPSVTLNTAIPFRLGGCPYTTGTLTSQPLTSLLRNVLENSDNRRTDAIERWAGGKAAFHNFADSIGMTKTRSNRIMGCSAPPFNTMTLEDLVRLHTQAPGLLGTDLHDVLIDRMLNSRTNFPGTGGRNLAALLISERNLAGLTASEYNGFLGAMTLAYKPGGKTINGEFYRTTSGLARIPFISNHAIDVRDYIFGAFAHGATNSTNAANAVSTAAHELLRDRIRAAMATWKGYRGGSSTTFGTSCVLGPYAMNHTGSGTPAIGNVAGFTLSSAPPLRPAVLWLGGSRTHWNGSGLPISLGAFGAPGCWLRVAPSASLGAVVTQQGLRTFGIKLPVDTGLVGQHVYTQYAVLVPGNALGVRTSNGLDTLIGGRK